MAEPTVLINGDGMQVTWPTYTTNTTSGSIAIGSSTVVTSFATATAPEAPPAESSVPWSGPVAFEDVPTGDHRMFAAGAITWAADSLPLPFRWVRSDSGAHTTAVVIGRVDNIYRDPASPGVIFANGVIFNGDSSPPEAAEYLDLLTNGAAGGVSVDGDSAEFNVIENASGDIEQHFTAMRLRSLTAVAIPAFIDARIHLAGDEPAEAEVDAVLASAIPSAPPEGWFDDPCLDGPTPLTITADGRVYGHLALFGTCHIAQPRCVTPPRGSTYAYFHTGELLSVEGTPIDVGHMTFNTGHAALTDNALAAASHYDNTGTVAADVRAGEDEHGIWLAGALRPTLTDDDIRAVRAAPPSGDWRRIGGRLELVAALAVNTPGFPVPRARARVLVASGHEQSVIAATPASDFDDPTDDDRRATKTRLANTLRKQELGHRLVSR